MNQIFFGFHQCVSDFLSGTLSAKEFAWAFIALWVKFRELQKLSVSPALQEKSLQLIEDSLTAKITRAEFLAGYNAIWNHILSNRGVKASDSIHGDCDVFLRSDFSSLAVAELKSSVEVALDDLEFLKELSPQEENR